MTQPGEKIGQIVSIIIAVLFGFWMLLAIVIFILEEILKNDKNGYKR